MRIKHYDVKQSWKAKDPFVDATKIGVITKDWIVTLHGLVPNEAMKQMAERDAWYVLGVKEVVNHVQVRR